jgi:hypothetical protein
MLNGGLLLFMSSIGDAVAQTAHASVWSAAVAIVMVAPSVGHIEASMVPMPVSVTDPNSDVVDPDIGAFRDDHRLIATFEEPANAGIVRSGTTKSASKAFYVTLSLVWGRSTSGCPQKCTLAMLESV